MRFFSSTPKLPGYLSRPLDLIKETSKASSYFLRRETWPGKRENLSNFG